MLRMNKKLTSLITAVAVATSLFICNVNVTTEEAAAQTLNQYGLTNKTQEGTILHAFSWNFNTIKSKMKEIAACGYSSIQVSPIEECLQNSNGQHTWEWENTYQPKNYKIGNYVVGSRDEFKSMCDEAEKYGIKIIVDVVANHLSGDSPLRQSKYLHNTYQSISNWTDRYSLTQQDLMGMPDTNTQSYEFQNIIKSFLDDCIACGADGFRFDTAKHIELPKDIDGSFGGDFWPNIVNEIKSKKSDAFVYGEVLQDKGDAYSGYARYIGLTADAYGDRVRDAIRNHNLNDFDPGNYQSEGVSPDKLVTYSETHDTYANYNNKSTDLNNWQVRKGYELVAARAKGTPLFLARPKNNGFASMGGTKKLDGPLGVPDNDWNDPEVAAVNKFHNAMVGQGEYIRKINNNTIAIERGNAGMVVINLDGGYNGDIQTNMSNGEYQNTITGNKVNVSNGRIHVSVASGQTAVIYKPGNVIQNPSIEEPSKPTKNIAYISLPYGWGEPYAYVYQGGKNNAAWPGVKMQKVSGRIYSYEVDSSFTNPLVIFNDRNHQYPGAGQPGLPLNSSMIYRNGSWTAY